MRDEFDSVVFKAEAIDALVIVDAPMEVPVVDSKLGDWGPPCVCTWSPPPPPPAPLFFGLVAAPAPPPATDRSFLMSVRRPIFKLLILSCLILSKGIPRDPEGDWATVVEEEEALANDSFDEGEKVETSGMF